MKNILYQFDEGQTRFEMGLIVGEWNLEKVLQSNLHIGSEHELITYRTWKVLYAKQPTPNKFPTKTLLYERCQHQMTSLSLKHQNPTPFLREDPLYNTMFMVFSVTYYQELCDALIFYYMFHFFANKDYIGSMDIIQHR